MKILRLQIPTRPSRIQAMSPPFGDGHEILVKEGSFREVLTFHSKHGDFIYHRVIVDKDKGEATERALPGVTTRSASSEDSPSTGKVVRTVLGVNPSSVILFASHARHFLHRAGEGFPFVVGVCRMHVR